MCGGSQEKLTEKKVLEVGGMLSGPSGKVNGSEINANFLLKNIYVIIIAVVPM